LIDEAGVVTQDAAVGTDAILELLARAGQQRRERLEVAQFNFSPWENAMDLWSPPRAAS